MWQFVDKPNVLMAKPMEELVGKRFVQLIEESLLNLTLTMIIEMHRRFLPQCFP